MKTFEEKKKAYAAWGFRPLFAGNPNRRCLVLWVHESSASWKDRAMLGSTAFTQSGLNDYIDELVEAHQ